MPLLYAAPEVAQSLGLANIVNSRSLVKGDHGRSSIVYRMEGTSLVPALGADAANQSFCVKRVTIEDQVAPHNVHLELRLLKRMEGKHVPRVYAATELQEDALTTNVSLLMGWYDFGLAALLDNAWFVPAVLTVAAGLGPKPSSGSAAGQVDKYVDFVQRLGRQLFSALAYLHDEVQIAHRDIKPANLMLESEGGTKDVHMATLKIIDFGTAVDLKEDLEQGQNPRCQTSQVGTASFRAPELLFAPTDGYDPQKADIWAAGCVLAMLYTGFKRKRATASPWQGNWDNGEDWNNPGSAPPLFPQTRGLPPWMNAHKKGEPVFGERGQRLDLFPTEVFSDIQLASSIFNLKGLPSALEDWPEGATFQPPLNQLPYTRGRPQSIFNRLPIAKALEQDYLVRRQVHVIQECTQLSAGRRVTAQESIRLLG